MKTERLMSEIIDLHKLALETNSSLWQISDLENEPVLQVVGNTPTTQKTGTAAYLDEDHVGKVALIGEVRHDYKMQADMFKKSKIAVLICVLKISP